MRYNCKALYTLDEVAEQCRNAIMKADERRYVEQVADRIYDEILTAALWEDDLLIAA